MVPMVTICDGKECGNGAAACLGCFVSGEALLIGLRAPQLRGPVVLHSAHSRAAQLPPAGPRSSPAAPGLAQVCGVGETSAGPPWRGPGPLHPWSVRRPRRLRPHWVGGVGLAGAWGRGGGLRGGGRGGMKLLQMLLRGSPRCPQPAISPPGRPRLECQTGVLPVLRETCGWSVGTEGGLRLLAGLGGGGGRRRGHRQATRGLGLALKWSGCLGSENENLAGKSCPSGSVVCGETCTIAGGLPPQQCHLVGPGGLGQVD